MSPTAMPVFRAATAADRGDVEQLLRDESLPLAGVADMFAADPSQFVVATASGAVVAVAGVESCDAHALLRSVAVRHDWQQRGLGAELVARAVRLAEDRGIPALYLLTMTADRYFPRFGFERIERDAVPADIAASVEFASACPASAIPMRKPLGGTA
ncbi:arsenic resistance N-acetyltransferase ArsN2 [Gemmatimonas sp.]